MVFELTDSLIGFSEEQEKLVVECVSNLLIGYFEGNHMLMASDEVITFFQSRVPSECARIALHHLYNNNSYDYKVLWRTKVVLSDTPNVLEHEINFRFFEKTLSIQPSIIISEDIDDIYFYCMLTQQRYDIDKMAFIAFNGGGGNTGKCIHELKKKNMFILAIADSDIKYPEGDIGKTCKDIQNEIKKTDVNMHLEQLHVHEIENMVPFPYLKAKAVGNSKHFLSNIQKKSCWEVLKYFDIKNGITKEDISNNDKYYEFAKNIYETLYAKRGKTTFKDYVDQLPSDRKVFEGIDSKILSKFIGPRNKKKIFEARHYQTEAWTRIQDVVFTFTCCRGNTPIQ